MDDSTEAGAFPITCLGMELDMDPDTRLGFPLDAFVVAKFYDEGEPSYRIISTKTLAVVEGLGMLEWGLMTLKHNILAASEGDVEDEEGEN